MKKFNIRKVLDGLTAASSSSSASSAQPGTHRDNDVVQETLQSEQFQLCKTVRHGFPNQPASMAFDPVQKILAVGLRPERYDWGAGDALADDSLHLWNLRQKIPAVLHSLKFNRERRGNIHIVNVESFTLSGYVIMWNKPSNCEFLLIGFECGVVVLWDLKCHSLCGLASRGAQFVCSHSDGTLTNGNVRAPAKTSADHHPHGKQPKDGKKPEPCRPILKVEYKTTRAGDPFMVLSGGLSYETVGRRRACLTVMHGKSTTVLEMDTPIVDFLTLCETPYPNDFQEPYAVVVLLEKDLVVIDLGQIGYPAFENPYPFTVHESPVTCCEYFADCPAELIPALYSVGPDRRGRATARRHADGTIKFWDASALMLQVLYKLKTAKVFERARGKEDKGSMDIVDEDPFAIQTLSWCPESRLLCVGGVSAHVIVYRFSKQEVTAEEVQLLEVRMQGDFPDCVVDSPEPTGDQSPPPLQNTAPSSPQQDSQDPLSLQGTTPRTQGPGTTSHVYTLCDSNDGANASEERCKSPTSGSTSPYNSDDERKQKFIDKVKFQSRRFSRTVANDFAKMSRKISSSNGHDTKDNSFSRSRSSSVTSIDRESREAISAFSFCESFARKGESALGPCLLVGTTQGAVMMCSLSLPSAPEQRLQQPVSVCSCGTISQLKGGILTMALLDASGTLLPPAYEPWCDPNASDEEKERIKKRRPPSPPGSLEGQDSQFLVLCSEKQAKVLALPSQTRLYKHNITEASFILRADVVNMGGANCLMCFCANGHIMALSLPSLRPLLDVNYLPLTDMRIARTFCFSNLEMLSELFTPVETPEAPNRGFFKGLFGGGAQSLDREDLFGETAAGKASRSLAQHIPGPGSMEGMKGAASGWWRPGSRSNRSGRERTETV
ncbi:hypothetical protein WMY93_023562 [Mugilogobius chulae]|uniref:Lethal giant larvae homologue 2 domain-containing protein n=1 Tax=Mugilogobius chulae TaxID=88201 RepID=A0AAW0N4K9_9GOBI